MEPMRIEIKSMVVKSKCVEARAHAVARAADIQLRVRFPRPSSATMKELRELARDEVLRYLDPA